MGTGPPPSDAIDGMSAARFIATLRALGFTVRSVAQGHVVLMNHGRGTHIPRAGQLSRDRVRFLLGVSGVRWEDFQAALQPLRSRPSGELPAVTAPEKGSTRRPPR